MFYFSSSIINIYFYSFEGYKIKFQRLICYSQAELESNIMTFEWTFCAEFVLI